MIRDDKRLLGFYLGIDKTQYPKWPGWIIIREYYSLGIKPRDIEDERLDCLVDNFYFLIKLSNTFGFNIKGL